MLGADPSREPLKILLASAEVTPFAKTGGLADVAAALPKELRRLGQDVRLVMPRYRQINPDIHGLRPVVRGLEVPLGSQTIPCTILFSMEAMARPRQVTAFPAGRDSRRCRRAIRAAVRRCRESR